MTPPEDFDPPIGTAVTLSHGLRRIVAGNPSPMTYRGTNTYLLGEGDIAVIDPGPALEPHMEAILAALGPSERITHIFVTHSHVDHSPLAAPLSEATGAPVLAYGDSFSGQSPIMARLAASGLSGGGEGVDPGFAPDITLAHGQNIAGDSWELTALHTPGHFGNHLSFQWGDALFCGDLVMGWASSLVSPPDGDLTDFMASCEALRARDWSVFHSGHGAPITKPNARLDWLLDHRRAREAQILETLSAGPATPAALTACIYTDTPSSLLPAAERNVFAHLVDLAGRDLVSATPALSASALFSKL